MSSLEVKSVKIGAKTAVVLLHGYGANMHDLFPLHQYIKCHQELDFYFPNGPIALEMGPYASARAWFPIDIEALNQALARGDFRELDSYYPNELKTAQKLVGDFLYDIASQYENIIVGGFSQGAMLTTHLVGHFPKNVKGMILFSGAPMAWEKLELAFKNIEPIPFFQSHGKNDPILSFAKSMQLYEWLKLKRFPGTFVPFNGGHEIPMLVLTKCNDFLGHLI